MPDLRRRARMSFLLCCVAKLILTMGSRSKQMLPCSGISSALRQRKKVVLPEPDGPRMTTTCPLATSKSTPRRMVLLPKVLWILRICIMVCLSPPR